MKKQPIVIDLFSGAGGFSEGFRQAGYNIVCGVDINEDCSKSYKANFENAKFINRNIREVSSKEILSICNLSKGEVDVIIGGPPCQGFSHAGKRLVDDPRNILFKEFVRVVNEIRPTYFVMENVVGLVTMAKGRFKKEILETFEEVGYTVDVKILNSADYGTPQNRHRTIFIGNKKGTPISFPSPTHNENGENGLYKWTTVEEAINDLPPLGIGVGADVMEYNNLITSLYQSYMRGDITYEEWLSGFHPENSHDKMRILYNHWTTKTKEKTRERFIHIAPGCNWEALPEHLKTKGKFSNLYRRLNPESPSVTLTNIRKTMLIHPWEDRLLTVREGARIQSIPDYMKFVGNLNSQQQQISDCVPSILSYVLARHIKKDL